MTSRAQQHQREELVSVIIPCYNQGRFLAEAIESALAQSYEPKEVIVVDDGSSDGTGAVAAAYDVRLVRQRNQGESAARNRGFRESSGAYLVFLDADDRLLPGAMDAGLNCFKECPECAFVFGGFHHISADGAFLRPQPDPAIEEDLYEALLRYNHIGMGATVMYRREVFERAGGFDPAFKRAADYDLYLRIAREFPIRRHERITAEYRKHGGGISENPAPMLRYVLAALRRQRAQGLPRPEYLQAWQQGMTNNRNWYVERIVQRFRTSGSEVSWAGLLSGCAALLRYDPRSLLGCVAPTAYHRARRLVSALRKRPGSDRLP